MAHVAFEKIFQALELREFSGGLELAAHAREGALQQGERPAAVENILGRFCRGRLGAQPFLGVIGLQRNKGEGAAALLRAGPFMLVDEEVVE